MAEQKIVVLFGDSLLMDTIEASLECVEDMGLMRIHNRVIDVDQRLLSISPDLVIFDMTVGNLEFVMPFLRQLPGVPLLGLDVTSSKIIAVNSQEFAATSLDDLNQVILNLPVLGNGNGRENGKGKPDYLLA